MRIHLASVLVQNQQAALDFYTGILGLHKHTDVPMGEHRWLTLVSSQSPDGVQLLLEPVAFPPAQVYQKALFDAGIPCTSFAVDDIDAEHARLQQRGVVFRTPPRAMGPVKIATFEDTCGNLIQIVQKG